MAAPLTGMKSGIALLEDPHFPGDDDAALRLFNRIADRISQDYAVPRSTAGDALDQALIFVAVAGQKRDLMLSPSPLVDWAWDTFILYTPITTLSVSASAATSITCRMTPPSF